jgi:DNA polymerase-1
MNMCLHSFNSLKSHLSAQASVCGLGIIVIERNGVEADDVIASLATRGVEAGMKVRVASPDKDFFQILGPNLRLLRPRPKGVG